MLSNGEHFDAVVGSDLVYNDEGAAALARCLSVLLRRQTPPPAVFIAHTCGRWGGYGYDHVLLRSLRSESLAAVPVSGETLEGSCERRQHVVIFRITPAAASDSGECNDEDHVLLRAKRLQGMAEAAELAAMSEEERMEMELHRVFDGLGDD